MKDFFKKIIIKILVWESKAVLQKTSPKIIGITGSAGKSSTKEAISAVLEKKFRLRKSSKSYNSELGMALAILGLQSAWNDPIGWLKNVVAGFKEILNKNFPQMLVLEMGIDRPKDMEKLLKIAHPEIAVLTAIGEIPVHVEFFAGPEEVAKEKAKIVKNLPTRGFAVLNFDDQTVWDLKELSKAHILGYGFGDGAEIQASNYKVSDDGISFKVLYKGSAIPVRFSDVFGKHYVYAALAAFAVGVIHEINPIDIAEALNIFRPPPGRLNMISGIKNSKILDDTYNASPLATHAALDTLAELEASRKIFIFGDMLEIGKFTIPAHQAVGSKTAKIADFLITVGPRAKFAAEEAIASGLAKHSVQNFSLSSDAADYVKNFIKEGDLVLVKGSQSMRMEHVVEEIMSEPDRAKELLCRQDDYWKKKK